MVDKVETFRKKKLSVQFVKLGGLMPICFQALHCVQCDKKPAKMHKTTEHHPHALSDKKVTIANELLLIEKQNDKTITQCCLTRHTKSILNF